MEQEEKELSTELAYSAEQERRLWLYGIGLGMAESAWY